MSHPKVPKTRIVKKVIIRTTIGINKIKAKWHIHFILVNPHDPASEIITQITVYYLHTNPNDFQGIEFLKKFKNHYLLVRRLSIQENIFNILSTLMPDQIQIIEQIELGSYSVNKFTIKDE